MKLATKRFVKKNLCIFSYFIIVAVSCIGLLMGFMNKKDHTESADILIYGGTSAAVTAAGEVAQSGKSVIIVPPEKYLGGLAFNGVVFKDI